MKQLIFIAVLFVAFSTAKAQQKVLPDTIRIKLTKNELQEIANKLDSVENILVRSSTWPSNQVAAFNARIQASFMTLWVQTNKQLIVTDTTKKPVVKVIPKKASTH